jgi:histidine ammonia-lyase
MAGSEVLVGGPTALTAADVVAVARHGAPATLHPDALARMAAMRVHVEAKRDADELVYGITTGFGALARVHIPPADVQQLQHNLVRSHAAGAGDLLPAEVVRAMMLLRARTLSTGHPGVRPVVAERLIELLNAGITPAVPSRGSVGASGDLAPLAHIGLCVMGEGPVLSAGGGAPTEPAADALRRVGIEPLTLEAKEGLALVNGTEGMLALGLLAEHDVGTLLATADVTAAMTIEAALGSDRPFAADLMALRPHPGQAASAANLRALLDGSAITASHLHSDHEVQDPYSMRCAPQVHGAARDAAAFCGDVFGREVASVTDNPVVLDDGRVESAGNFHGEPLAYALDLLAIAVTGTANISERRTAWLLAGGATRGLPQFLTEHAGLSSGFMIAQYTQAALVSECKGLGHPASLDSIPTSGLQEDHVSMGWTAGLKLRAVLRHVATVLAIEGMCAAQGLDLRAPLEPAAGTRAARRAIRARVPHLDEDRSLAADIAEMTALVASGALLDAVREEVDVR